MDFWILLTALAGTVSTVTAYIASRPAKRREQAYARVALCCSLVVVVSAVGAGWDAFKQSERQYAATTGGDSKPVLMLLSPVEGLPGSRQLLLINKGDYPILDLKLQIRETAAMVRPGKAVSRRAIADSIQWHKDIGALPPEMAQYLDPLTVSGEQEEAHFSADFYARNGHVYQRFTMRRVSGAAVWATSAKGSNGDWFHFQIDPGFPRDEAGEPLW